MASHTAPLPARAAMQLALCPQNHQLFIPFWAADDANSPEFQHIHPPVAQQHTIWARSTQTNDGMEHRLHIYASRKPASVVSLTNLCPENAMTHLSDPIFRQSPLTPR